MKTGTFSNISKKYLEYSNLISEPTSNLWISRNNNDFQILRDGNYWEYKKSLRKNKIC